MTDTLHLSVCVYRLGMSQVHAARGAGSRPLAERGSSKNRAELIPFGKNGCIPVSLTANLMGIFNGRRYEGQES